MMSYKISVTTRVSVTADTAEEATEIYRQTMGSTPARALPQVSETWEVAPEEPQPAALPPPSSKDPPQPPDDEPLPQEVPGDSNEGDHRRLLGEEVGTLTLQEAIDAYLAAGAAGGKATETLRLDRYLLGLFRAKCGAAREVASIDETAVSGYLGALTARGLASSYISTQGKILKAFFNWLVRRGTLKTSPMAAIKLHSPHWKPVPPFSADETHRLLDAATDPMERATVALLLDTGMRAGELTNLKLAQVDLEQNLIRIKGKGGKNRTVALNDRPKRALETYLASRPQDDGALWPRGLDRVSLWKSLQEIGKRANVANVHPHRFRHTFASRFLQQTGDAMALQALLGHSTLTMVQHYIRAAQADIAVGVHKQHSLMDTLS